MAVINHRHVLIKDGSTVVGKFDQEPPWELDLPDGLTVQPIRIPDDIPDRSRALQNLTDESVEWDERLIR